MVMNAMLKKLGYRGETAKDGMEAVKASWRQKFELILMVASDSHMHTFSMHVLALE